MPPELRIATADLDGVRTIVDWAAAEGWNPGLHDATAFHGADPDGFLLGSIDDEPIGAISVVRYGAAFAFLGLYIVRPAWRGRGHGLAMWRAGMTLAGDRTIGLDGVVEHQADYARSGFTLVRRNIRYGGVATLAEAPGADVPPRLEALGDVDRSLLEAYDAHIFPAERGQFLDGWLAMPDSFGLASREDGALRGYGVARRCRVGVKIGPLFADDESIAESLFSGLAAWARGAELFLDVPEPNGGARRLAERHGLAPVFETARMYAGSVPDEPVERIYGVTTFELG